MQVSRPGLGGWQPCLAASHLPWCGCFCLVITWITWGLWLSASLEEIVAHGLIQGKIQMQNSKYSFYWTHIIFVSMLSPTFLHWTMNCVYLLCGRRCPKYLLHTFRLSIIQGRNRPRDQAAVSGSSCLYDHHLCSENHIDPHGFELVVALLPLLIRDQWKTLPWWTNGI